MKKLLIAFSALTFFFAACNNDKTASAKEEKTTTTDNKDDKDDKSENKDDAKTSDDDRSSSRSGWSPKDINDFVNSCVGEASKGMTRAAAEKYCECMQVGIEKMYPVANDAARIDMESEEVKNMVMDCLN